MLVIKRKILDVKRKMEKQKRNIIGDSGIQVTYHASLKVRTVKDERNKVCDCLPLI